ncbi:MAG: hypothetical protein HYZ29_35395 [Myxococcales bacterium]|nr:hypothetical protein [Myxococcales bacterium]
MILKVETPDYGRVVVEASDGNRYHASLLPLAGVYCFPKTRQDWERVAPDSHGLALVWTTRFEAHVDQVMGLADRVEPTLRSA